MHHTLKTLNNYGKKEGWLLHVNASPLVVHFRLIRSIRVRLEQRPVAHATRGCQCRQECCECGYYHLHPNLNQSSLLHTLVII